ncbi:MAG TPA: cytochrome c maturation protein CcmE [Candidatus Eisenbacteria bacterium]|nr:cytochrome c maturation protein CcmE [Candidatus Eisenbacteria bacterium]
MNTTLKILIVSLVVIGSVAYLILSGVKQTGMQYMTVTELAQMEKAPKAGGFRLDGIVAAGSVQYDQKTPRLRFRMTDGKEAVNIVYEGLMPDAFADGRDVVVEGTFQHADRTLHATKLVTKCPSKYESEGLGEDKS